jgi:death on curing protein
MTENGIGVRYVNKRMIVVINRLCLEVTGIGMRASVTNLRHGASLGFVDQIFHNSVFGDKIYPDIFHQAAAYMFHVIKDHVFVDGNKRTGLACAVTFLQWNNVVFGRFDEEEAYAFVIDVAAGPNDPERVVPRIARWLEQASVGIG